MVEKRPVALEGARSFPTKTRRFITSKTNSGYTQTSRVRRYIQGQPRKLLNIIFLYFVSKHRVISQWSPIVCPGVANVSLTFFTERLHKTVLWQVCEKSLSPLHLITATQWTKIYNVQFSNIDFESGFWQVCVIKMDTPYSFGKCVFL